MRAKGISDDGNLRVLVVGGTRAILIAADMKEDLLKGFKGFAFRRRIADGEWHWLTGIKAFVDLLPKTQPIGKVIPTPRFPTNEHPVQSFLWGDYQASPGTVYEFEVSAMFGTPGALEARHTALVEVTTEVEDDGHHGIWFNRGAIASQAYAEQFKNKKLSKENYNNPDSAEVKYLSRGLLEACLGFIRETPKGDALRVVAYEFTYQVLLLELKAAMDRGVDVKIVHDDKKANITAIKDAALPETAGGEPILFKRTRPDIPHNKFIVRLEGGKPTTVFTGSTNFTPSGFLGQTNVGHKVTDPEIAGKYLKLWTHLKGNPDDYDATLAAMDLTKNPSNVPAKGTTAFFSPRPSPKMLEWYGSRAGDAVTSVMFTAAFKVDERILGPMADADTSMRFILLERPPSPEVKAAQKANPADLQLSYGAVLGQMKAMVGHDAAGKKVFKIVPIPNFKLEKWFLKEELARNSNDGFVFYVHTKFLLVDPLSDDPLVCTGSANFSSGSLVENDENMLLIRADTRVADIYLTEYDRVFRHFFSRGLINQIAKEGGTPNAGKLEPSDKWWKPYFDRTNPKDHKRRMFFEPTDRGWAESAASGRDVFALEKMPKPPKAKIRKSST
ncbi:phospholipase D-like domain-containing protein [Rhizobium leguminosarum]|uniref:phospholipase D-like domain-containing protein n=1 Tax=Rhizobium leguminosarum TaxID=384 RepID=UPI001C95B90D|nr:phospholipase D-like domain-containing protein [Rhizobium leguminosarum]MBY5376652.1 hypothetical protein [Rhizobium leguminosarum]